MMFFYSFNNYFFFQEKKLEMNFSREVEEYIHKCTSMNAYFNENPTAPKIYILITTKVFYVTFFVNYKTPISEEVVNQWFLSWGNPISKKIYLPTSTPTKIVISSGNVQGSIIIRETSDTAINTQWCAPTYEVEYFLEEGTTLQDMKRYVYNHIHSFFTPDPDYFEGDIYDLGVYTEEEGY